MRNQKHQRQNQPLKTLNDDYEASTADEDPEAKETQKNKDLQQKQTEKEKEGRKGVFLGFKLDGSAMYSKSVPFEIAKALKAALKD